jgi:hypothetical protein
LIYGTRLTRFRALRPRPIKFITACTGAAAGATNTKRKNSKNSPLCCRKTKAAYVFFNNIQMTEDAQVFQEMVR